VALARAAGWPESLGRDVSCGKTGRPAWRAAIRIHPVLIAARRCADHVVVTRLAAGLAQERRYPAIRRDRSCRDWIGLFCTRS
jgi:hypothetical protein